MDKAMSKTLLAAQADRLRLAQEASRTIMEACKAVNELHAASRELRKALKANGVSVESLQWLETPKDWAIADFKAGIGMESKPFQTLIDAVIREGMVLAGRIKHVADVHGQPVRLDTWNNGGKNE